MYGVFLVVEGDVGDFDVVYVVGGYEGKGLVVV